MPLLVAIDEYESALRAISVCAELGLQDASLHEPALRIIKAVCEKTDEIMADVMPGAVEQAASILHATAKAR